MRFAPVLHVVLASAALAVAGAARLAPDQPDQPSGRIVGGLPVNDLSVPYFVSLLSWGSHSCGGSVISERTVLTAAHCLVATTARRLRVHAGARTRSLVEGVVVPVARINTHPSWSSDTMDYDVGLVRLARPLVYSASIQPIQLPRAGETLRDGSIASVAGFGYTSANGPGSQVLRYARVPIVGQATCRRLLGARFITDRMVCAGLLQGGVDACQMDSGGPLVAEQRLVGIVSWGIGCALRNRPGVYARVSELRPWIDATLSREYGETV